MLFKICLTCKLTVNNVMCSGVSSVSQKIELKQRKLWSEIFKKRVSNMLSEEKQAATKKLYANGKVPPEEVDAHGQSLANKRSTYFS